MSQNTTAMQRGAGGETTGATDMTTRQPEALDLADWLIGVGGGPSAQRAAALLRSQHARITELEAQLEAVGAGGVGPLIADAGFDAADMATAAAQGFRDGVASVAHQPITDTNTASGAADKVLAYLDDLSDDAAAHIFPSDLAKCMTSECVVEVVSVRAGNPNERTVPLFSREQVVAALASTQAQPVAEPAKSAAYAALPEPLEIDWPELHSQALGCGVEDRDLHNRYECAEYGWQDGADKCAERVPEQIFDADQMLAFADATHALRASHGQAYPTIGDLCARIKAADDAAADRDYMLDSNDCIAVLRGEWKGPLTMDKPERASHGQAPATQQVGEPECYKWEHYCRWGHGWGWGECESEYDPRLPENKQYHTEDFNDPEQVRNFRALYRHTPPSLPTAQADSVPAVEREQERIAFKDAHRHLDLDEMPDAWGRPMFKHSHVEASWLGWIARASRGQAPTGANENAKLVTLIAECRDAFPIPAHGDPIENYWSAAIEDPANVPAYLQEIAKRKQAGSVQDDSALLDWLLLRVSGAEFRRIGVHYSGNARRADVDAARKQGASHDR